VSNSVDRLFLDDITGRSLPVLAELFKVVPYTVFKGFHCAVRS
jgi:hypothetical protein